jgi:hypothetical protein
LKKYLTSLKNKMIFYKIRDKETGLFSKGGVGADWSHHHWSKSGKVWRGLGPLRSHLNQYLNKDIPLNWEVIEYETVEKTTNSAAEMVNPEKLIEKLKQK